MVTPRKKISQKYVKEFIKLYKKGLSTEKIGKILGFGQNTVLRYLKKKGVKVRNPPTIPRSIKKSSWKLTKEKASMMGVLGPGDGYVIINDKKGDYIIGLQATDKKFVNFFEKCLSKVYGLKVSHRLVKHKNRKNESPLYCREIHSKLACLDLIRYGASFKEKNWRVPEEIKEASTKIKAMYIKGMADSQGSVCFIGTRNIQLASKNEIGLKDIKELLFSLGILDCSIGHNRLTITARRSFELFANKINFTINYKKFALKKLLKSYKYWSTPKKDMPMLIPKIISLRKIGLSYQQIADKLKISHVTVRKHLNRLSWW